MFINNYSQQLNNFNNLQNENLINQNNQQINNPNNIVSKLFLSY